MAKPTKLRNLIITNVDLVPEGANPEANIVLFKSKKEGGPQIMTFKEFMESLTEEQQATINAEIQRVQEKLSEDTVTKEEHELLEIEVDSLKKKLDPETEPKKKEDEILKSLDPEIATLVKGLMAKQNEKVAKMAEQVTASQELVTKMAETVAKKESITKAKTLEYVQMPTEDIAKMLNNDEDGKIYEMLKAMNASMQNSEAFTVFGKSTETPDLDTEGQIEKITKGKMEDDKSMNYSKAYALTLDENPELYAQMVKEQRGE